MIQRSQSGVRNVLLPVLAVDVGESSLLGLPLHPVSSAGHQAVHHVQRVVVDSLQHEPSVRAVQETGGVAPGIFLLQRLSVSQVQPCHNIDLRTGGETEIN